KPRGAGVVRVMDHGCQQAGLTKINNSWKPNPLPPESAAPVLFLAPPHFAAAGTARQHFEATGPGATTIDPGDVQQSARTWHGPKVPSTLPVCYRVEQVPPSTDSSEPRRSCDGAAVHRQRSAPGYDRFT